MRHFRTFLTLYCIFLTPVLSQSLGKLAGKIVDEKSGEVIIGANIVVVGTTLGSVSDLDGKFVVAKVPPGTYDARISMSGYAPKLISKITIGQDETITINVTLTEQSYSADEVVVTADAVRSTEAALLAQRKNAPTIGDGISAEQIKRTPDVTSGDALKRVTGVSLVDNKFVFIRGITDRYNETTLDGAQVTSTEVGKKSFSFDLLPANLLENTSVVKSATPDLPGDFSGGLVQLNTLDFPSTGFVKINVGSSYNTQTTSQDILTSQGGNKDWLGFDDGIRAFTGDKPNPNQIAQQLPNTWAPLTRRAPYNKSISLSAGNRIDFDNDDPGNSQFGIIGALSYRNSFQRNEKNVTDVLVNRFYSGTNDVYSVLWGGLLTFSYKFAKLHKITFRNNLNQSASDEVSQYSGIDYDIPQENRFTIINWTQRTSYTGQLVGEHMFPSLGGLSVQWRGSVSTSKREDPDRKEVTYYANPDFPSYPFSAAANERSWAHLNERVYNLSLDFAMPLFQENKIKFGSLLQTKTTGYVIRHFRVTPDQSSNPPIPDSLKHLPLDQIYAPENFGPGKYLFGESSKASDAYDGDQKLFSTYAMIDVPVTLLLQKFRFIGGARLENSEQNVHVTQAIPSQLKNIDVLPSANLVYLVNSLFNIRAAYWHSVNRPDFRELASTGFYDFVKYELDAGNDTLRRAIIHNFDIRAEFFPDIGELFAVSYFQKDITDAIEEYLDDRSTRTRTWYNSKQGKNTGWELEIRKSMKFLGGYFGNFSVMGNYTHITSSVDAVTNKGVPYVRPLQGQSPYVVNISFLFTEPRFGTAFSILYNKFGRRLDAVGFRGGDIYEEPRDLVDMIVTQPFGSLIEAKFTIKNLSNKDRVLTRNDLPYDLTSSGRTYTLQMSVGL